MVKVKGVNQGITGVTRTFNVDIYCCSASKATRYGSCPYLPLSRLLGVSSVISVRTPLGSEALGLVKGRRLRLVGPATCLIGTNHNTVIIRGSLTRTISGTIVTKTNLSIFIARPVPRSRPCLGVRRPRGVILDPRVT